MTTKLACLFPSSSASTDLGGAGWVWKEFGFGYGGQHLQKRVASEGSGTVRGAGRAWERHHLQCSNVKIAKVYELPMNHLQSLKNTFGTCFLLSSSKHTRAKKRCLVGQRKKERAGWWSLWLLGWGLLFLLPSDPRQRSHAHPVQAAHVWNLPITRLPRLHFIHLFMYLFAEVRF